jgi:hypothetical protein
MPLRRYQGKTPGVVWAISLLFLKECLDHYMNRVDRRCLTPVSSMSPPREKKRTATLSQSGRVWAEDQLSLAGECTAESGDLLFDLVLEFV